MSRKVKKKKDKVTQNGKRRLDIRKNKTKIKLIILIRKTSKEGVINNFKNKRQSTM